MKSRPPRYPGDPRALPGSSFTAGFDGIISEPLKAVGLFLLQLFIVVATIAGIAWRLGAF